MLKIAEFTLLACRLLLAGVFVIAGATKLVDPAGTRKALRDFSLPSWFARPMVLLLPLLELAVAAALIPGGLAWYGARGALALLIAFMVAVVVAMLRGRKPDCHCFGQLHSAPVGTPTLIRNGVLALIAGWLATKGHGHLGPDLWVSLARWYTKLGDTEQKLAIVAAGALGFLFVRLLVLSRPHQTPVGSPPVAVVDEDSEDEDVVNDVAVRKAPAERPASASKKPAAPPAQTPAPAGSTALGLGLPIGTPAPEFELPGMTGAKRSLQSLRKQGKDVLLVFSSPFCKPCQSLPSNLVSWARELERLPTIVLISRGTPEDNRAKLKEFGTSQVLLQRSFEVGEMYDCIATPAAVLVGTDGLIQSDLAQGGPAIKELLTSWSKRRTSEAESTGYSEATRRG